MPGIEKDWKKQQQIEGQEGKGMLKIKPAEWKFGHLLAKRFIDEGKKIPFKISRKHLIKELPGFEKYFNHSMLVLPGESPPGYKIGFLARAKIFVDQTTKKEVREGILGHGSFGVVKIVQWQDGSTDAVKIEDADSEREEERTLEKEIMEELGYLRSELIGKRDAESLWIGDTKITAKRYTVQKRHTGIEMDDYFYGIDDDGKYLKEIDEKKRYKIALKSILAIQQLHEKGIIHTDIKPENFMLNWRKEVAIIASIDFGFSKRLAEGQEMVVDLPAGSRGYIAPEIGIFREKKLHSAYIDGARYSKASDVYALGIMLKEDLRLATAGSPLSNLINRMISHDPADRPELKEVGMKLRMLNIYLNQTPPNPILKGLVDRMKAPGFLTKPSFEEVRLLMNLLDMHKKHPQSEILSRMVARMERANFDEGPTMEELSVTLQLVEMRRTQYKNSPLLNILAERLLSQSSKEKPTIEEIRVIMHMVEVRSRHKGSVLLNRLADGIRSADTKARPSLEEINLTVRLLEYEEKIKSNHVLNGLLTKMRSSNPIARPGIEDIKAMVRLLDMPSAKEDKDDPILENLIKRMELPTPKKRPKMDEVRSVISLLDMYAKHSWPRRNLLGGLIERLRANEPDDISVMEEIKLALGILEKKQPTLKDRAIMRLFEMHSSQGGANPILKRVTNSLLFPKPGEDLTKDDINIKLDLLSRYNQDEMFGTTNPLIEGLVSRLNSTKAKDWPTTEEIDLTMQLLEKQAKEDTVPLLKDLTMRMLPLGGQNRSLTEVLKRVLSDTNIEELDSLLQYLDGHKKSKSDTSKAQASAKSDAVIRGEMAGELKNILLSHFSGQSETAADDIASILENNQTRHRKSRLSRASSFNLEILQGLPKELQNAVCETLDIKGKAKTAILAGSGYPTKKKLASMINRYSDEVKVAQKSRRSRSGVR